MSERKECPICFSSIDKRAARCPHCQKPQNKYYRIFSHPGVVSAYGMVFYLLLLILLGSMLGEFTEDTSEPYAEHRQSISAFDTTIQFGEEQVYKEGNRITVPTVIIIGYIENNSPFTWGNPVLEVRFYDDEEQLIDTSQGQQYSLILPERDVCAFKIAYERLLPEDRYKKVSVKIVHANDLKSRWPW